MKENNKQALLLCQLVAFCQKENVEELFLWACVSVLTSLSSYSTARGKREGISFLLSLCLPPSLSPSLPECKDLIRFVLSMEYTRQLAMTSRFSSGQSICLDLQSSKAIMNSKWQPALSFQVYLWNEAALGSHHFPLGGRGMIPGILLFSKQDLVTMMVISQGPVPRDG